MMRGVIEFGWQCPECRTSRRKGAAHVSTKILEWNKCGLWGGSAWSTEFRISLCSWKRSCESCWRILEQLLQGLDHPFRGQSPVTHTHTHKINTPNTHILLTQQQCCNCFSCDRRGVSCWAEGVAGNSVRRPNTMFQPQMGHISSPQSTNLALPSLHALHVKRDGKGKREKPVSSFIPPPMLLFIACHSL